MSPRTLFCVFLALLLTALGVRAGWAADLQTECDALCERYAAELTALADEAEASGMHDEAALARGWRPRAQEPGVVLFIVPDQYSAAAASSLSGKRAGDPWSTKFHEVRAQQAKALFELAKRAADEGQLSFAFQWATEAVREDPNHADARRVLGDVEHDGRWLTAYGAKMAERGQVWHPKFGWIRSEDLSHWEAGERPAGSKWVSAEVDAQRHARLDDGWQVRTDHFLIKTNHSLEAGAELAARLERLYQVWQQLFAGFQFSQSEVRRLFSGERQARIQSRPFRVYYYRSQDEYVGALRRRQPRIESTIGIYFDTSRDAHFFAGEEQGEATLHHEAVHQLFQESRPAAKYVGATDNFWIVEGIATYFESLRAHHDPLAGWYYTIGEPSAGRLPAARERFLSDAFLIPFEQVTKWGKDDVQRHAEIKKVYSQAAGMTTFLMHGQRGRFREPMVRYLQAVYAGKDDGETLAELTGETYDALDKGYAEFLKSLP